MMNVNEQLLWFRKFLLDSWEDLDHLMKDHDWEDDGDFIDEWLQVNWEFLVERQLLKKNGFLNSYGIYYKEPRVTNPTAKITHLIVCRAKNNQTLFDDQSGIPLPENHLWIFRCFYKKLEVSHGIYPPFDTVGLILDDGKTRFYVHPDDVDFFLCAVEEVAHINPEAWYFK